MSVHLTITVRSSGAQRLFDHSVFVCANKFRSKSSPIKSERHHLHVNSWVNLYTYHTTNLYTYHTTNLYTYHTTNLYTYHTTNLYSYHTTNSKTAKHRARPHAVTINYYSEYTTISTLKWSN